MGSFRKYDNGISSRTQWPSKGDENLQSSSCVKIELNSDKAKWVSNPVIRDGNPLVLFEELEVLSDEILR